MSEIHVVWANTLQAAQAEYVTIANGQEHCVLYQGEVDFIQVQDVDSHTALDSGDKRYCIVFELR